MNYKDIKTYAERCDSHPDHQTGIITNQMIMDRLHDEIEDLREYIEAKSRPLPDDDLFYILHNRVDYLLSYVQDCGTESKEITLLIIDFARAVERAHGIGEK